MATMYLSKAIKFLENSPDKSLVNPTFDPSKDSPLATSNGSQG